jgi:hypothetical protein
VASWARAKAPGGEAFYATIAGATLLGVLINFSPVKSDKSTLLERGSQRHRCGSSDADADAYQHQRPNHAEVHDLARNAGGGWIATAIMAVAVLAMVVAPLHS